MEMYICMTFRVRIILEWSKELICYHTIIVPCYFLVALQG